MKNLTISPDVSIRHAMKALDETAEKCLLVVDEKNKLHGTLTDGDLRRSILTGAKVTSAISSYYNDTPTVLVQGMFERNQAKQLLLDLKIDLIPVIDNDEKVVDYITWSKLGGEKSQRYLNDVPVVIMAGGKGTRMEPFTKVLPKPLIPIQDKPIIEHIIEKFTEAGCCEFYMTVNYKSKIMKAFFEELDPEYDIQFIDENEPLGTAGSLGYLEGRLSNPFFVSNCDILIHADYPKVYDYHLNGGYDVTLVASTKEYIIPYGTCELNEGGSLSHINEKPSYEFLVNTGLYVLNPNVLTDIPENKFYHLTHLIEDLKNEGRKVGVFPVGEDAWIDIGQWAEYHNAIKEM